MTRIDHDHNQAPEPLRWRFSTQADLDFILATEQAADNRQWIFQWTAEQHLAAMQEPDCRHLILEAVAENKATATAETRRVGYALLYGFANPNRAIELRRLAISEKGRGLGHAAMRLLAELAFGQGKAHRFWLDLYETNSRALHLYESEGFSREGLLRDHVLRDGSWHSFIVMSILEDEYRRRPQ
ncbi:MAG: GNAT family N-acetyltransferase [Spirochaetes bacterium]|nr:GNAT family N-acetyltransferase [Spirochaetota bacterium]